MKFVWMRGTDRLAAPASWRWPLRLVVVLSVGLLIAGESTPGAEPQQRISPGHHGPFVATAYCDSGTTKAGVRTRRGIVAADPDLLPVGSVLRVKDPEQPRYDGIYTVMDTGSAVQGRKIDLFVSDCDEAKEFGLKRVQVRILRLGWNPRAIEWQGTD